MQNIIFLYEIFTYNEFFENPASVVSVPFFNNKFLFIQEIHEDKNADQLWFRMKEISLGKIKAKTMEVCILLGLGKTLPGLKILLSYAYNRESNSATVIRGAKTTKHYRCNKYYCP